MAHSETVTIEIWHLCIWITYKRLVGTVFNYPPACNYGLNYWRERSIVAGHAGYLSNYNKQALSRYYLCLFDTVSLPPALFPGGSEGAILSQRAAGRSGRLQGDSCFAVCGSELQWSSVQEAAGVPETPQRGSDPEPNTADPQPPEAEPCLGGQQLVLHQLCDLPAGPPGKGNLSHLRIFFLLF